MKHKIVKSCLLTTAIASLAVTTLSYADALPPIPGGYKPGSIAQAISTGNMLELITDLFEIPRNQYLPVLGQGIQQNAGQLAIETTPTITTQTSNDVQLFVYTSIANSLPGGTSGSSPYTSAAKTNPLLPMRVSGSSLAHNLPLVNSDNAYNVATQNLNAAVLMGNDVLNTTLQPLASNFIQFIGDAGDRVTPLGLQTLKQAQGPLVISYLNNVGTYFAGQSVGLSVLYFLANERMPLKGYKPQGADQAQTASALSVEKKNDTWRMNSDWSQKVATMTPVDLMREQVMMQAQMLNEMYMMKQQIEMLNVTMATMQLEAQQTVAKPLLQGKQQEIIQTAQTNTNG